MNVSPDDLRQMKINENVAREAYDQAGKLLSDVLDAKKVFEQKAFTLFSAYITISLAFLGYGGAIYKDHGFGLEALPFIMTGVTFAVGAYFFVAALRPDDCGAMGSIPDLWLRRGIIDGDDSALASMMAYITHYHQGRIDKSIANNVKKARLINCGMYIGFAAPVVLIMAFVLDLIFR